MVAESCSCLACWSAESFSNCSACEDWATAFLLICSKPICLPITKTKSSVTTEISSHGAHQLALRRKSLKVLLGAMKVSMMRAPSESGGSSGGGRGIGVTGIAAMQASLRESTKIVVCESEMDKRRQKPGADWTSSPRTGHSCASGSADSY